jgi:hypothetical protein
MRKFSIFFPLLLLAAACNNNQSSASTDKKADSAIAAPAPAIEYAYKPKDMPNWEMGNPEYVAMVLNALKKYETNRIDELSSDFADSVWFGVDKFIFHGTKDSLIKIFKKDWENTKSVKIDMHDWEAVHGKDNKEDWVSLWYKQTWVGKDGKVDSAEMMDDLRIVNGKIRVIDSKKRDLPAKK